MDLSKLYYEKELEVQEKIDAERNLQEWIEDCKKVAGYDANYEFKNITMKSTPAYFFKFDFQKLERTFEKQERAFNGEQDFPINPIKLHDLMFDSYSIENISVLDDICFPEDEDKISRLLDTQQLHVCPTCKGKGVHTCKKCDGRGWIPCSRCKNSGRIGYIKEIIKRGQGYGEEVGKEFYGPEGGTWRYVKCPKCTYSRYGQGRDECSCNNGIVKCNRCKTTGKVVTFISNKDHYFPVKPSLIKYWHGTIPEELKSVLKDVDMNIYAEPEPLNDTEESLDSVSPILKEKGLDAVLDKYEDLYNSICLDNNADDYSEDNKFVTSRITKVNVRVYKVNIIYITYDCNGKKYELWFYGKDNSVFTQDNPFMAAAKLYEKQANDFFEKKKYAKAVKPLEKACKVADITCNHGAFSDYANMLKTARKKSNVFYIIGTILGAIILSTLFFVFPNLFMHTSGRFLKSFFDIQEQKYIELATIIENIIITTIFPSFFSFILFKKIIRNRITNKVLCLICSIILPIIYALSFGFLEPKVNFLTETVYSVLSLGLLFLGLIILFAINVPYNNYTMTSVSEYAQNDTEKKTNEETDNNSNKESNGNNEISPKNRKTTLILSILFGFFGAHNFYANNNVKGVIQFGLTCISLFLFFLVGENLAGENQSEIIISIIGSSFICINAVWIFVDIIKILAGSFKDENGAKIKKW